jgi:hypothetical protein
MTVPYDPAADKAAYDRVILSKLGEGGRRFRSTADAKPREGLSPDQLPVEDAGAAEMRKNRRIARSQPSSRRTASSGNWGGGGGSGGGGGLDLQFATGRPRDPLFYWRQNNLPYDFADNEELEKIRAFCRLLYQTDPIIGSCIDIFSKLPVAGMEVSCKDPKLEDFYRELFFSDEGLDYEEFFVDLGREYFTVGEAWPFATFNESLGIWDDEELLAPEDIKAERSPFLKDPRYFIRLPQSIREVLRSRRPVWEYERLVQAYPELVAYTADNAFMPVSSVLLRQLKFKGDTFNIRGIPLLTRAMRSVLQQEMLNSALDSIADRMYTPLVLFKLGASASDLGTEVPWIPTEDDLGDFQEATDAALAADFRAIFYNFAVETELVFGREQMPDLTADFERIEDRMLQTFGLSRTFLTGATSGGTYAADALNKELLSQLMTRYQKLLKRHYRQRALVVAEAQEHYDYDLRNGQRYVRIEEVLETNEETGEQEIVEQPKLLIPDITFPVMDFRNEDTVRQLIEALHEGGVPISRRTRMRGLPVDLDEESETVQAESIELAVAEQETRKGIYRALRDKGLPIPEDLKADFTPRPMQLQDQAAAPMMRTPEMGMDPSLGDMLPNLDPNQEDLGQIPPDQAPPGAPPEEDPAGGGGIPQRPEESDEMRAGMPTAAHLFRRSARARAFSKMNRAPQVGVSYAEAVPVNDGGADDGRLLRDPVPHFSYLGGQRDGEAYDIETAEPVGAWATPAHVGQRRRYAAASKGDALPEFDETQDDALS